MKQGKVDLAVVLCAFHVLAGCNGSGGPGEDDGTGRCQGANVDCGGTCVQLDSNPNHCGACGRTCIASDCVEGACDEVRSVSGGGTHTCGLRESGGALCWGRSRVIQRVETLTGAVRVSAGNRHACALVEGGTVACWGEGVLGDGTDYPSLYPVEVAELMDATQVSAGTGHSCAVRGSGAVVCWGNNGAGQLGDGSTDAMKTTPVAVLGVAGATTVAAGGMITCALHASGQVSCWGVATDYWDVSSLTDVVEIGAGHQHGCAVLASGHVSCWGHNDSGQLGDGTTSDAHQPVEVVGIESAVAVTLGFQHSCALLADGPVLCWGENYSGQLGDGTQVSRSTAAAVVGLDVALEVDAGDAHNCAIRDTGQVVCWGDNGSKQLGDGTSEDRATPVPVDYGPYL